MLRNLNIESFSQAPLVKDFHYLDDFEEECERKGWAGASASSVDACWQATMKACEDNSAWSKKEVKNEDEEKTKTKGKIMSTCPS